MKRTIAFLCSLLLLLGLIGTVAAQDSISLTENSKVYIIDEEDLLTDAEEAELQKLAAEISQRQECDVVLLTVYGLGRKTPMEYADDYFDYNGYGWGEDRSGLILLISMEERDWWISTRGYGITAFTDYGIQDLANHFLSDLSAGNYYRAFRTYFLTADDMLTQAKNGQPVDDYSGYEDDTVRSDRKPNYPLSVIIALLLGFLLASLPMMSLKAQVKNVGKRSNAADYIRANSMHMDVSRDIFLYANTTTRRIETQSRTGGGGHGGGSSIHISSSGASHGGGGGKF